MSPMRTTQFERPISAAVVDYDEIVGKIGGRKAAQNGLFDDDDQRRLGTLLFVPVVQRNTPKDEMSAPCVRSICSSTNLKHRHPAFGSSSRYLV
jgi:hypothetical protein